MPMLNLSNSELATVLHGLRMIQETANGYADCLTGCCDHFDDDDELTDAGIDALCERLNVIDPSKTLITIEIKDQPIVTGHDLAGFIEQARKMVEYNMGPEPARSTSGPIYEHIGPQIGQQVGTWTVEL